MDVCGWIRALNNPIGNGFCNIWVHLSALSKEISLLSSYFLAWIGITVDPLWSGIINIGLGLFALYKVVGMFKGALKVAIVVGIIYVLINIIGISVSLG